MPQVTSVANTKEIVFSGCRQPQCCQFASQPKPRLLNELGNEGALVVGRDVARPKQRPRLNATLDLGEVAGVGAGLEGGEEMLDEPAGVEEQVRQPAVEEMPLGQFLVPAREYEVDVERLGADRLVASEQVDGLIRATIEAVVGLLVVSEAAEIAGVEPGVLVDALQGTGDSLGVRVDTSGALGIQNCGVRGELEIGRASCRERVCLAV